MSIKLFSLHVGYLGPPKIGLTSKSNGSGYVIVSPYCISFAFFSKNDL